MDAIKFPKRGYAPTREAMVDNLRELALWIETGEYSDSEPHNIIVIIEHQDGHLSRVACGQGMDRARGVGVLQLAISQICVGDL